MKREGPDLSHLMLRVRNCLPEAFAPEADPVLVLLDFLRDVQKEDNLSVNRPWGRDKSIGNLIVLSVWLYYDPTLAKEDFSRIHHFLSTSLMPYASLVSVDQILKDPLRTEEFVRRCLAAIDLRPKGETKDQAADRLQTLDSIEAERLEEEALIRRARAQEVLREMQKAASKAAAAKVSRE